MGNGPMSSTQVAGSGNGRRGEDLKRDQVGDIAPARRITRDDHPHKFVWPVRAKLAVCIRVGDEVRLTAKHRIDLAEGENRRIAVAADRFDILP